MPLAEEQQDRLLEFHDRLGVLTAVWRIAASSLHEIGSDFGRLSAVVVASIGVGSLRVCLPHTCQGPLGIVSVVKLLASQPWTIYRR